LLVAPIAAIMHAFAFAISVIVSFISHRASSNLVIRPSCFAIIVVDSFFASSV
jgi:hypothetical protein